jgi:hypothetical protein
MKKIILAVFAALLMGSAVAKSDVVIGYDGDCQVYFRPDSGYFEVCEQQAPVFLGAEFDVHTFRRGFREGPNFHEHFGRHWSGPQTRYETKETVTEHRRGR